jgi:hypothetical protein
MICLYPWSKTVLERMISLWKLLFSSPLLFLPMLGWLREISLVVCNNKVMLN